MTQREALADYAHEAWCRWIRSTFEKCYPGSKFNACTIPDALVKRWTQLMNTPYKDLPESEKKSDRAEADKIFQIMREHRNG